MTQFSDRLTTKKTFFFCAERGTGDINNNLKPCPSVLVDRGALLVSKTIHFDNIAAKVPPDCFMSQLDHIQSRDM